MGNRLLPNFLRSIAAMMLLTSQAGFSEGATGSIAGDLNVNLTGSAGYAIPIRVAPGTAGMAPRISLVYDSQAPSGSMGAGWSISGLSNITRGPKNIRSDGIPDGVKLTESDALYLDGQRIIPVHVTGSGAARVIEYKKELDDQTKIIESGVDFQSSTFVVKTKGGVTIEFLNTAPNPQGTSRGDIRLSDGTVLLRSESRLLDSAHNFIDFFYKVNGRGNYDIQTIKYTGHEDPSGNPALERRPFAELSFAYQISPIDSKSYIAGREIVQNSVLTSIEAQVLDSNADAPIEHWKQVSRYELAYQARNTASRFVLASITQFGDDDIAISPTVFQYSNPTLGWQASDYAFPAIFAEHQQLAAGYKFIRFSDSKPALPDLLYSTEVDGVVDSFAFKNSANSWTPANQFAPPIAFVKSDGTDLGVVFIDVKGDGRPYMLQSYQNGASPQVKRAYLATASGWAPDPRFELPFLVSKDGKRIASYRLGNWTGGDGSDIVYESGEEKGFLANTAAGWVPDSKHSPPLPLTSSTFVVDLDCSGVPALVGLQSDATGASVWKSYRFTADQWSEVTDPALKFPVPVGVKPAAIRILNTPGSNCVDLLVASAENGGIHQIYRSTPSGWQNSTRPAPPFDLVDSQGRDNGGELSVLRTGDDMDVIAHKIFADGFTVQFAYFLTAGKWNAAPASFSIPILRSELKDATRSDPFVGDLTGDGVSEIAIPRNSRQSFGDIYFQGVAGFEKKPDYLPPTVFAKKDQQDLGVRMVDLNADGLVDILISRDGVAPLAYVNNGAGWLPSDKFKPPVVFSGDKISGNPVQFVDVDGDGYVDMLYSYRDSSGKISTSLFRNVDVGGGERGWSDASTDNLGFATFVPPKDYPFAADKLGDMGVRFVDLMGTGRPMMLVGFQPAGAGAPQLLALRNDGDGWKPVANYAPPVPFVQQLSGPGGRTQDLFVKIIDVNGDGLPDIVASYHDPANPTNIVQGVWLNTGSGWVKSNTFTVPVFLDGLIIDANSQVQLDKNANITWSDLNGDGIPDIIYTSRFGDQNRSVTYMGTGSGWINSPNWSVPIDAVADRNGDSGLRVVDVNGDGFPDLYYARTEGDGTIKTGVFVNSGNGWLSPTTIALPQLAFVDKDGNDLGVRLYDVDGRGLLDVIQAYRGDSLQSQINISLASRAELLNQIDSGGGIVSKIAYKSLLQQRADTNDGSVDARLFWSRNYEPPTTAAHYPVISPVPATYAVRRIVHWDGQSYGTATSYRYGGYAIDILARKSLGFSWREDFNEATSILSHAELVQDFRYPGRTRFQSSCLIDLSLMAADDRLKSGVCASQSATPIAWSKLLTESMTSWQLLEMRLGKDVGAGFIRQLTIASDSVSEFELDGRLVSQQVTDFVYDPAAPDGSILHRHENLVANSMRYLDGATVSTVNVYDSDDEAQWYIGRLTRSTVTRTGVPTVSTLPPRSASFAYDGATGLLSAETADTGTDRQVRTSYVRDIFGNIISSEIIGSGISYAPKNINEYDSWGRFPIRNVNAAAQATLRSYEATTGLPSEETDPNGVVAKYRYDGVGRLIESRIATGVNSELISSVRYVSMSAYHDQAIAAGIVAAYAVETNILDAAGNVPPQPRIVRFTDGRGRVLRTVTNGFTADDSKYRPILRDVSYNNLGLAEKASLPYEPGQKAVWTVTGYDRLGRIQNIRQPNGAVTAFKYEGTPNGGLLKTTIDPLGHKTTVLTNSRQLALEVTDSNGGVLTFGYDAFDHVVMVKDPIGAVTRYTYDGYGNRVAVADPNFGRWSYKFDSLGRMTEQLEGEAESALHTYVEYDALNRVVSETTPSEIWRWAYDDAQHGVGKPSLLTSDSGRFKERYAYDEMGRIAEHSTAIVEDSRTNVLTKSFQYDELGRQIRINYPDGFSVINSYDRKGFMVAVIDAQSSKSLWRLQQTDAFGHVSRDTLGNGVSDLFSYDQQTGLPVQRTATTAKNSVISSLKSSYDLAGNMLRRDDAVAGQHATFGYDALNRLTQYTSPSGSQVYRYDAAGRFTFKTGVGSYEYGHSLELDQVDIDGKRTPSHAVLKTSGPRGTVQFRYDNRGNLLDDGTQTFEYSSENRLTKVEKTNTFGVKFSAAFSYGPKGERYREVEQHAARTIETLSIAGFEKITEYTIATVVATPRFIRNRYSISNADGVFAVVERSIEFAKFDDVYIFHAGASQAKSFPTTVWNTWYLHTDTLGSVVAVTDESASVRARYSFDPWGKRLSRIFDPLNGLTGNRLEDSWKSGFVGQEHLTDFELIHLNGRVYDPTSGLFTSVDPINQAPLDTQLWNPYNYGRNNPLRYVDPGGYSFLGSIGNALAAPFVAGGRLLGQGISAVGNALDQTCKWVGQNWREVVIIAAVIVVTYFTAGLGTGFEYAILAGMAGGATGGALTAALYGGSAADVLHGALLGAAVGGVTAGLGYGVGYAGLQGTTAYIGRGVVGGVGSELGGGSFEQGFIIGATSEGISDEASANSQWANSSEGRVVVAAVSGGTASELTGGKFSNGAISGAFTSIFSQYAERSLLQEGRPLTAGERDMLAANDLGYDVDPDKVRVVSGRFIVGQDVPMSPNGNIYIPPDSSYCEDYSTCANSATFIHEATHVGQFQSGQQVSLRGLYLQTLQRGFGVDVYSSPSNMPQSELNIEQQAQRNEDAYRRAH